MTGGNDADDHGADGTDMRIVVVTPARNEEQRIGATIASVLAQTRPPQAWAIVDDGSTDRTADVVERAIAGTPWIMLIRRPRGSAVGFASKVHAFREGLAALGGINHDLVANLDADVSLPTSYFERLASEFTADPHLGVAGGNVQVEVGGEISTRRTSPNAVAGAVQCFRRSCFEQIGGLPALERGGEDAAAQITARSRGWSVRTIDELSVIHHGPVMNRKRTVASAFWSRGIVNRGLGYDPVFQVVVAGYRAADPPYVLGGVAMLAGYVWAALRRSPRVLPDDVIADLRSEQRDRLRTMISRA